MCIDPTDTPSVQSVAPHELDDFVVGHGFDLVHLRIVAEQSRSTADVAYQELYVETHGIRKAETLAAVLEAELAFLQRALRLR